MHVLTKSKPKNFCIYLCKRFWKNVYHRLPYHWNRRTKYFFLLSIGHRTTDSFQNLVRIHLFRMRGNTDFNLVNLGSIGYC